MSEGGGGENPILLSKSSDVTEDVSLAVILHEPVDPPQDYPQHLVDCILLRDRGILLLRQLLLRHRGQAPELRSERDQGV